MLAYRILIIMLCISSFIWGQVFTWQNPNLKEDSLKKDSLIQAKIEKEVFQKDTLNFITSKTKSIIDEAVIVKPNPFNALEQLNTQGSIIRGITFGNAQGSSVQSSMDLQIAGQLSKDVSILASISDHNLPIQADGYTQTLDEFDKIYLQLNLKKKTIITAGHLDLDDNTTFFGRYQRRSLGLGIDTKFGKEHPTRLQFTVGVARSEFHRLRFQGKEGNQGPYRLLGKNGEPFITIISGSEQVFIDGILMKRGENQDYTINYNTGEITFTSFRPIYNQNFITISYNYANRNYTRFLVTGGVEHQRNRLQLGLNWFLESDQKNAPLALDLSEEDKKILAKAGNQSELMLAPSGTMAAYDVNKILYRKVHLPSGAFYYEFSTDQQETLYQVAFTYFGMGKGDYRLKQTSNNGSIYEYVGTNLGDYSAVRKLPTPQKSQVISAHTAYALDNGKIELDASLSQYDRNLFSSKDNQDNIGYATRLMAEKTFKKGNWRGTPSLEYQHINTKFHILDRINSVEFARDFNLSQEFNHQTQHRLIFGFKNDWNSGSHLNYQLNWLKEGSGYQGFKNDLDLNWDTKKWLTQGQLSMLKSQSDIEDTQFLKVNLETQYKGNKGFWTFGSGMERNTRDLKTLNTLEANSFAWKEIFVQKTIGTEKRSFLKTKVYARVNDSVQNNQLTQVNHLIGWMAESEWIKNENTTLTSLIHYRNFFYNQSSNNQHNQDFVLGNLLYHQQLFNNGLRLQTFYELGNGQEAQREFQYLKVTDGQGIYKWTDYNGDGIQQLDEFEIAEYSDLAQYIRIYTNTVKYTPSNKNKWQLALYLNPAVIIKSENAFLKRWNFNFSLLSQNSFYKQDKVLVWNPFERNAQQILKNQNWITAAQFLPNERSGWTASYRWMKHHNILNANFSEEEKHQNTHYLTIGYRITKDFRADWDNQWQRLNHRSELFKSRDYDLSEWKTHPKLTYQLSNALQAEISSAWERKTRLDGTERLNTLNLTGSLQWEHHKTMLRGSFSFINNDFKGNSFSVVGNQMLNGLKAGKNQVWNAYLQQAISRLIHLQLNYEGRNSDARTIHIGSVQVRASF